VTEWPQQRIAAHAIGGNLKQMDGSYTLETQADGRVRLAYSARLVPAFAIPPLVGKPVLRQLLKRQFRALVDEIQRREALTLQEQNQTAEISSRPLQGQDGIGRMQARPLCLGLPS
jgi:hypothetical protein